MAQRTVIHYQATDVTGYGLLGHAYEMAEGAGLSIHIRAEDVPVLEEAQPYVDARFGCGGSRRNQAYSDGRVRIEDTVTERQRMILHDVQTSGGLLLAASPEACGPLLEDLRGGGDVHTAVIGEILSGGPPIVVS